MGVQYALAPRPHTHNRHMPHCFNQTKFSFQLLTLFLGKYNVYAHHLIWCNLQCWIEVQWQYALAPRPHTHNRHMPHCFNQLIFIKLNFLSGPRRFLHRFWLIFPHIWFIIKSGAPLGNALINWVPVERIWKTTNWLPSIHLSSYGAFISQPFSRSRARDLLKWDISIPALPPCILIPCSCR